MPGLPTASHIAATRMIRRQAVKISMSPDREPDPNTRELKVLTANFGRVFEFLGEWDETVKRSKTGHSKTSAGMEFPFVKISVADAGYEEKLAKRRISTSLTGPLCRDLCLEEELQARLDRMTRLARSLHYVCSREKWLKQKLCGDVRRCKENAEQLLKHIVDKYEMQLAMWQKRKKDTDVTARSSENENVRLRAAIDKMVDHAARTIEGLELELTRKAITIKALNIEIQEGRDQAKKAKDEKIELQDKIATFESAVNKEKSRVDDLSSQLQNMEKTKEHYETLLDIALTKLKRYEEDGHPRLRKLSNAAGVCVMCKKYASNKDCSQQDDPYSQAPRVMVSSHCDSDSTSVSADIGLSAASRRRLIEMTRSDSVSITSFDTNSTIGSSIEDISAASVKNLDQHPPLVPMHLVAPNAMSSPGKRRKKKSKGLLKLLHKSSSLDSQLLTETRSATDLFSCSLPPIEDETGQLAVNMCGGRRFSALSLADVEASLSKEACQCNVSQASVVSSSSCLSVASGGDKTASAEASNRGVHKETSAGGISSRSGSRSRPHSPNISASGRKLTKQQQVIEGGKNGKATRRLNRSTSFAALRPKANTFVTLARDLEKRLKRRRRCKTADSKDLDKDLDKLPEKDKRLQ